MDAIKYRRAEVSDEGRENVETLGARFLGFCALMSCRRSSTTPSRGLLHLDSSSKKDEGGGGERD